MANLYVTKEEFEALTPDDIALVEEQGEKVVVVSSQAQSEELTWRDMNPVPEAAEEELTPEEKLLREIFGAPESRQTVSNDDTVSQADTDRATPLAELLSVQKQLLSATQESNQLLRYLVLKARTASEETVVRSATEAGEKIAEAARAYGVQQEDLADYARRLAREENVALGAKPSQRTRESDDG